MRQIPDDEFDGASALFYRSQTATAHLHQSAACSQTIFGEQSIKSV